MASLPPIDLPSNATGAGAFDAPAGVEGNPLFEYLLRLGDDSLVLGQRLSEWCGHAPSVEVDLSLANMALDLIGQATLFLDYAGEVEGKGRDGDSLAFHRDVLDFRCCWLVEQPNGDFARTMARQCLFSTWQHLLFGRLAGSADERIAAIAAKAVKEVAYHRELASEWVIRLGDGTEESRRRMADGLDWTWRFVAELFEMDPLAGFMAEKGIGTDLAAFRADYDAAVRAVIEQATLPPPPDQRPILGGRRGHHSEHLGHLLATMQFLPRTYPDARW
ncbi:MAG: phenylacetate-CoA oxygenase subunit PaaC [Alphaproteobacteria bacterium]|nr:phenylacetate-CoA oxygenase subunit PaaC [Alphaproteobacteria bacterium]MBV9372148.1 phenylacetate-CoA oxygenase subunit PaaC [Alphaproteobacteria bacterium]MBV9902425.1 phenylacetate-CoA oxygenase subunit PaaC [Alphaproteobacteria bacterium]